jgi:hypothetical protein
MPKKKGGGSAPGGDKRLGFFAAIRKQKLETVRWSMLHGGQFVHTRDDDNMTCLMVCAMEGKANSLNEILQVLGRQNSRRGGSSRTEAGESVDGLELRNDDGMTALMLGAANGKKECCALLVKYGANVKTRSEQGGQTARQVAEAKGYRGIVEWFDRGCEDLEEEVVESAVTSKIKRGMDMSIREGESETARSRRLRKEMEARESGAGTVKKEKRTMELEEVTVFEATLRPPSPRATLPRTASRAFCVLMCVGRPAR